MQRTYVRYQSAAESNFVGAPGARPVHSRGNAIITSLIWIIVAIVIGVLVYRYFGATVAPATEIQPALIPTSVPTVIVTPDSVLVPCVAVSDACGNVTPVGVRAIAGTVGYHTDADGRVRINPPAGWISMPDCKASGLRVWAEFDENGDIIAYHCAKQGD